MKPADIRCIHFVGIKGVAMTALALYAKGRGIVVGGSDVEEAFPTDELLQKEEIHVVMGFDASHISASGKPDLVIYTGAHGGRENVEVIEAEKQSIPVLPQGKALGFFMEGKKQISVAGSHGKTTTSAMIATILSVAGIDPSYAIGCGEVFGLGFPGHFGKGEYFVAEADEYVTDPHHDATPRFLWQSPRILVVTNIDYDHPDVYPSLASVQVAFEQLRQKVPANGYVIVDAENAESERLQHGNPEALAVGLGNCQYRITSIQMSDGKTRFVLQTPDGQIECTLQVPGLHNVRNAAKAAVAANKAGVSWEDVQKGLWQFAGTKRRFERIGTARSATLYDDYAHHPHEIEATLAAAAAWFPKRRVIAVFQPHTYSRTKALLAEFAEAFISCAQVFITDIYASAREKGNAGINAMDLVEKIRIHNPNVAYTPGSKDVGQALSSILKPDDIVFFMGAGDIYSWEKDVIRQLTN